MYAKIDLMLLCFLRSKKQRQCQNVFWQRVHFPLENVQHHIFQRKMLGLAPFFFAKQKNTKKKNAKIYFCKYCARILLTFLFYKS
jgi:hypothetical protein